MKATVKHNVFVALERPRQAKGAARAFGLLLLALILLNAVAMLVEADTNLSDDVRRVLLVFETVSAVVFAVEYAARLWTAPLRYPDKGPARARVRYAFSAMGLVDLFAFAPVLLAAVTSFPLAVFGALRLVRLVRLVKATRYMCGMQVIMRVVKARRAEIVASAMVVLLLAVTASVLMFYVESPVQPEVFDSAWTGLYWAMTTITSTGYGDIVPLTPLGRAIGFCVMALSIAAVAIPGGIFSAGFVAEYQKEREEKNPEYDEGNSERDDGR